MDYNANSRQFTIRQLLDVNQKLSQNLENIRLLIADSKASTGANFSMLTHQTEEAIVNFSRFRTYSYSILGIDG